MKNLLCLTKVLLILCTSTVFADNLKSLLQSINSFRASFKQVSYDNQGKLIGEQSGSMIYARPKRLFWRTLKPDQREIIVSDSKLWIYDVDLMQVTEQAYQANSENYSLLSILEDFATLKKRYSIKDKIAKQEHIFELSARKNNLPTRKILLKFLNKQLIQINLLDHLEHMTVISFTQIKKNKPIDTEVFKLKVPQGIDYIKS